MICSTCMNEISLQTPFTTISGNTICINCQELDFFGQALESPALPSGIKNSTTETSRSSSSTTETSRSSSSTTESNIQCPKCSNHFTGIKCACGFPNPLYRTGKTKNKLRK